MGTPVLRPPLCPRVCVRASVRPSACRETVPVTGPNKRAAVKAPVMQRSVS